MQPMYERQSKFKLIASLATIIVVAGIIVVADHEKSENRQGIVGTSTTSSLQSTATSSGTSTVSNASSATSSTTTGYKDGTYSATSSYYVPHSTEDIQVSVTLKDGVITASSVTNSESDPDSAQFQESFTSAYKSYVVGKSISGLSLNTISGASDTTQGFNDALSKIASEAQA
jgi:uncharacterized protein with FMN-binding domain